MKNKKSILAILIVSFLFIFQANSISWAYRGCEADFCDGRVFKMTSQNDDDNEIIRNIEQANKEHHSDCVYDYYRKDSKLVVYCKRHGSGSNISALSTIGAASYYRGKFNKTGEFSMLLLGAIGILVSIVRAIAKKRSK